MKKIVFTVFVLLLSLHISEARDVPNQWRQIADNSFLNTSTIFGTDDIYGFTFMLKAYNKGQYEPINGKNIAYTVSQYTVDCGNLTYKIGVIDSYSKDGNFINGDYNRYAKFRPIVIGTSVDKVSKNLCRQIINP